MKGRSALEVIGIRFERLSFSGQAALAFLLAALWLLGRRYGGIVQDASLYLVQGLRKLEPGIFGKDLFFAHGSQDAYTVFPYLYARLIDWFGIGAAAAIVTVTGQAAFFAAALALTLRIASGPARWWSLALVAVMSGYYGGIGVHRLAEPFSTARSLAEPLVVAALACTLAERHRWALAALTAAAFLHPLVAAPGIAVVFLWHVRKDLCLLWPIALLATLVAAFSLAWDPISARLDPIWSAVVLDRSPQVFVSQWLLPDWSRMLWGLCVAYLALDAVDAPVRRMIHASAAACLAGVTASWIAVDLLQSAAAAALQMWRAHWVLHLLALLLAPVATASLWRLGNAARVAAACIAASCCFGRAELPAAALLSVVSIALALSERRSPRWMGERTYRLSLVLVLCAAAAGLLFELQSRMPLAYDTSRVLDWADYVDTIASVGGLLPLAALVWLAAYSRFKLAAVMLSAAAFALGAAAWDARKPWPLFVEQASAGANPFRDVLPADAVAFWPGPYGKAWLALGRPSWISVDQGAGVVFNRGTAVEYARRAIESRAVQSANDNCAMAAQPDCGIGLQPARELCQRPGGPSHLVLNGRIEGHRAAARWPLPASIRPGPRNLYLYSCRDLAGGS
jgi:hypothetical protein